MNVKKTLAGVIGLVALACSACGSPAGTAASSARTAASSPPQPYIPTSTDNTLKLLLASSPPPEATSILSTITCSGQIGASDPVAFVVLHTVGGVLRDYADPAHPRTVCQLPGMTYVPVIDAHHVLLSAPRSYYAVVQVPEVAVTWFQLPSTPGINGLDAISPNLDEIVYLLSDSASNTDQIHVVTSAGDAVAASVPAIYGRCGSSSDSKPGDFTRSGRYAYVLDESVPNLASLVVLQGSHVLHSIIPQGQWAQGTEPIMAVWSPTTETLYYTQKGDVWQWTASRGARKFMPGVTWYYPTISADGTHLAYAVGRADGLHDVYLVDLTTGGRS